MNLTFYKYHGTGNDFIMIDNRDLTFSASTQQIANLCHRRFGIGADGLILLQKHATADFEMVYYNNDGSTSTMCGNGGRCIVNFAQQLGVVENSATFMAVDGLHEAQIDSQKNVQLKMCDTALAVASHGAWFVNTGSPHHVVQTLKLAQKDVFTEGRKLRNAYGTAGANVNFAEIKNDVLHVRTYERGVEDETYSCGTGVTAAALVAHQKGWLAGNQIAISTPGGDLLVKLEKTASGYKNIWLIGPAVFVFSGKINL